MFISSVRRGLEAERDALPGLIQAIGHEPRRFEDYTAQAVPSRQACLDGVEDADAYVLLLGELYGDRMPDSGLAPTEEEFTVARRRGIPILAFRRRGVTPELVQAEFISRVEDYVSGHFRGAFTDPVSLNTAVAAALRQLEQRPSALDWQLLSEPVRVGWRASGRSSWQHGTILETHLVSLGTASRVATTLLDTLPVRLARAGRDHALFGQDQALDLRASEVGAEASTMNDRREPTAGVTLSPTGEFVIWSQLPSDMLGSIIDRDDLAFRIRGHLALAAELVDPTSRLVPAVGLFGLSMASEGDAAHLGRRNSATMAGFGRTADAALVEPRESVPARALGPGAKEIAAELAARLVLRFREVSK